MDSPIAAALRHGYIVGICSRLDRLHPNLRQTVGAMTDRARRTVLASLGWTRPDGYWTDPETGAPHVTAVAVRVALLRSWGLS